MKKIIVFAICVLALFSACITVNADTVYKVFCCSNDSASSKWVSRIPFYSEDNYTKTIEGQIRDCVAKNGIHNIYDGNVTCPSGSPVVGGSTLDGMATGTTATEKDQSTNTSVDSISSDNTVCPQEFVMFEGKCTDNDTYCKGTLGTYSKYDENKKSCVCRDGYAKVNAGCIVTSSDQTQKFDEKTYSEAVSTGAIAETPVNEADALTPLEKQAIIKAQISEIQQMIIKLMAELIKVLSAGKN